MVTICQSQRATILRLTKHLKESRHIFHSYHVLKRQGSRYLADNNLCAYWPCERHFVTEVKSLKKPEQSITAWKKNLNSTKIFETKRLDILHLVLTSTTLLVRFTNQEEKHRSYLGSLSGRRGIWYLPAYRWILYRIEQWGRLRTVQNNIKYSAVKTTERLFHFISHFSTISNVFRGRFLPIHESNIKTINQREIWNISYLWWR